MSAPAPEPRTGIVVLLDALAPGIAAARYELDPPARNRIELHVTLLFPFVPRREVTPELVDDLRRLLGRHDRPSFTLDRVEAWPGQVVYAALEPPEVLLAIMRELCAAFREYSPYGGLFTADELVPHATLAPIDGDDASAGRARVGPLLPVRCEPAHASLIEEFEPDRFRELEPLPFAPGQA